MVWSGEEGCSSEMAYQASLNSGSPCLSFAQVLTHLAAEEGMCPEHHFLTLLLQCKRQRGLVWCGTGAPLVLLSAGGLSSAGHDLTCSSPGGILLASWCHPSSSQFIARHKGSVGWNVRWTPGLQPKQTMKNALLPLKSSVSRGKKLLHSSGLPLCPHPSYGNHGGWVDWHKPGLLR